MDQSEKKERKKRTNTLQNAMEAHFGIPFGNIVNKYFKVGMSRYACHALIAELTQGKFCGLPPAYPKTPPSISSLWYMIIHAKERGEIKDFYFDGYKGKRNTIRKKRLLAASQLHSLMIHYSCQCGHHFSLEKKLENINIFCLKGEICPACLNIGKVSAHAEINGYPVRKAIIKHPRFNIEMECYVNELGTYIPEPNFKEVIYETNS